MKLQEKTMNRTLMYMQNFDTGCISPYGTTKWHAHQKAENDKKDSSIPEDERYSADDYKVESQRDNVKHSHELSEELKKSGFTFFKVHGIFNEHGVQNPEVSYFVVDRENTGKLRGWLIEMGRKFKQDSIIFSEAGTGSFEDINSDKKAKIIDTSSSDSPYEDFALGKPHVGMPNRKQKFELNQGATFVKNRPFSFKESRKALGKRLFEGTGNFVESDGGFPIVAYIVDYSSEDAIRETREDYPEETEGMTDEEIMERNADESQLAYSDAYDYAKSLIDDLEQTYNTYECEIKSGYYDGIQLVVSENSDNVIDSYSVEIPEFLTVAQAKIMGDDYYTFERNVTYGEQLDYWFGLQDSESGDEVFQQFKKIAMKAYEENEKAIDEAIEENTDLINYEGTTLKFSEALMKEARKLLTKISDDMCKTDEKNIYDVIDKLKKSGWKVFDISARFSSGETWYTEKKD